MIRTFQLYISGIVQGVGFRPYIYNLAEKQQLKGWVCNTASGVYIRLNSNKDGAHSFLELIKKQLPEKAFILESSIQEIETAHFSDFSIIESFEGENDERSITPDFAVCPECLKELIDTSNRRNGYSFITCTNCGPRYSIIKELPYDRIRTTMNEFQMCEDCQREYTDHLDRRFFSQTNSCKKCGVRMKLYSCAEASYLDDQELIISKIITELDNGKIIAIKGIGGYMLIADAHNSNAIKELRRRKNRPEKPFALMVQDLSMLDRYVNYSSKQKEAFLHESAPIVLFDDFKNDLLPIQDIASQLSEMGIMHAYSPLHYQLLSLFDRAIIATSGNLSGTPIIFDDERALTSLSGIADFILLHNRKIHTAQDDSLIRFTKHDKKIVIRRARGLAPSFIRKKENHSQCVLAFGAMLKSTFSFLYKKNTFVSHYIGNSNSYETQESYKLSLLNMQSMLSAQPEVLLCDKHPGYFSHDLAQEYASENQIPLITVQHHKAHFTAIMGEHDLWNQTVCGIVWDGTGLGDDGNIWGGEAFIYTNNSINHFHQLPYQIHILGDKMVNEPRVSALSFFSYMEKARPYLQEKFNELEWKAYRSQLAKATLKTSSIGRLFDAVASIVGLIDITSFHGQAAMLLEALALAYENQDEFDPYPIIDQENELALDLLLEAIIIDKMKGADPARIAFRFHQSLLMYIKWIARISEASTLAFSGGVFQNKLLVDLIDRHLSDEYSLYFHTSLSPNDESISFGQLMYYIHIER